MFKGSPSRVGASDATTLRLDNLSYHDGKAVYVNESGLYKILLGSMKPEAESFQRWLTKEVLPSLRRTGAYNVSSQRPWDPKLVVSKLGKWGREAPTWRCAPARKQELNR